MPVYQLLGGPCRSAVPLLCPRLGRRSARAGRRCAPLHGGRLPGDPLPAWPLWRRRLSACTSRPGMPKNAWPQARVFDDEAYLENIPRMFAYLRDKLGFGPKLTHDVHEHLRPHNAVAPGQAAGTVSPLFPGGPAAAGTDPLVPPGAPTVHHAPGHGRTLHQPPRVDAADHRAADRLCARARLQGRRHHPLPQDRDASASGLACTPPGRKGATTTRSTRWRRYIWI